MNYYDKNSNNFNLLTFLYIFTFSIAFISKIGRIETSPVIYYGISIFWIMLAIFKWAKNGFKLVNKERTIKRFFLIFMIPRIIIHIYSLILYILGETSYLTRNTQTYLVIISIFSVIYIFKNNALKFTIIAALLSYLWVIIYNISVYGIVTLFETVGFILSGDLRYDASARLYEVHDYTFAIGYIILYYILLKNHLTKTTLVSTYLFIIFLLLGLKRIQIIAIFLVITYSLFTKFIKNKVKFYEITGYLFTAIAYIFIYLLSNSSFFDILNKLGINSMGRNYYYKAIIDLCEFSPSFLGLGRNTVAHLFSTEFSYMRVGGLHSDILKYFSECGFIMFGIWLWYYLVKVVKWLNNRYSIRVVSCYFILTLYSFIIYYTDNIDIYFVSQFIYIIIVCGVALEDENLKLLG